MPVNQLSFHLHHRTAMAAAYLSRSRGVAGVGTTKGLFFIFTLLCVVHLATSLTHKEQLVKIRETFEESQRKLDTIKAQRIDLQEKIKRFMVETDGQLEEQDKQIKIMEQMQGTWEESIKFLEEFHTEF